MIMKMRNILQLVDGHGDITSLRGELFSQHLGKRPCEEVRRRRLDANLGEHHGTRLLGRLLIPFNHPLDPGHLSSHVKVMGAVLGARLERKLAILEVRAHSTDEDEGLLGQGIEVLVVQVANFHS